MTSLHLENDDNALSRASAVPVPSRPDVQLCGISIDLSIMTAPDSPNDALNTIVIPHRRIAAGGIWPNRYGKSQFPVLSPLSNPSPRDDLVTPAPCTTHTCTIHTFSLYRTHTLCSFFLSKKLLFLSFAPSRMGRKIRSKGLRFPFRKKTIFMQVSDNQFRHLGICA